MTLVGKPFWANIRDDMGSRDFVAEVKLRAKRYFDAADQLGLIAKWREGEAVYFMRDVDQSGNGYGMMTKLDLGTRKDPYVRIKVPEVRSLGRQQLAFLMGDKTAFRCVASMGETRSVLTAQLADPAINYVYEERIRPQVRKFAEKIIRYGAGATHLRWDATQGDDVQQSVPVKQTVPTPMQQPDGSVAIVPQEQTSIAKVPAKSGAPFVDALTPFEMAYDPIIGERAGWVVAFERTNLYALAGQYGQGDPAKAEQILGLSTRDDLQNYRLNQWTESLGANEGDVVAMHFYYADRPEMPGGRYALIVGDMVVLDIPKCPLKAGRLPVRVLLTSPMDDCAFSFCDGWSHHGAEEALNRIRGSRLTNIAYFGDQVLVETEGTNNLLEEVSGGGRKTRVKRVPRGAEPPKAMEVAPMTPDAQVMTEDLLQAITRNSGFTDVSRGGTAEKTSSGAHLAGYEAITARNLSLTQGDLVKHEEELANDLLEMLRNYANSGFIAEIAGKDGAPIAKLFAPDDLSSVRRARAIAIPDAMRGPLARTQLIETTKDIEDPKQRAAAVNTILHGGDAWGKADDRSVNLLQSENERLINGEQVEVGPTDDHVSHLYDHRGALDLVRTLDNPDPTVIDAFAAHMNGHAEAMQQLDPVLAKLLGLPDPPVLPGNPAFKFAQLQAAAQQMLAPPPPPDDPKAAGAGADQARGDQQQQQPAPTGAQPEAAA